MLELLLAARASPVAVTEQKRSLLHLCAWHGSVRSMALVLRGLDEAGALPAALSQPDAGGAWAGGHSV